MKSIPSEISNFLIQNEHLINRDDFQQVYARFNAVTDNTGWSYFAFYLTEIFINSGIDFLVHMDHIPDRCFSELDIKYISIPSSIKEIGEGAFRSCRHLSKVQLTNGIERIDGTAFYSCPELKAISLPDSLTHLGSSAFDGCVNLNQVTIGKNLHKIESDCFLNCVLLKHIIIPDSITVIETGVFDGSGLEELKLPHSLERLISIVWGCKGLKSIYIPKSCTSIDTYQFRYCPELQDIYFEGSEQEWQSKIEYEIRKEINIHFNVKY